MSLAQKISDFAAAVGAEVKSRITASHPGVAKAWVYFGYVGEQLVVRAAYNVQSVTRLAAGKYRVHFARAMPDANYVWHALARDAGSKGAPAVAADRSVEDAKTADFIDVVCVSAAGKLSDTPEMNLLVLR